MSMDPTKWINTLPFANAESNKEKYKLDSNKWLNTLPRKDDNILILTNTINSNTINSNTIDSTPQISSVKKYSLITTGFVVGLILVSVIKNETRNLQREISTLNASVDAIKLNLYQTTLDHEVITSPENISRLVEEYLESDFAFYKKSQIRQLNGKEQILTEIEKTKHKEIFKKKNKAITNKMKLRVAKKIKKTKTELKKLQELYSEPEKLPSEIRIRIVKKIKTKKNDLKRLSYDPYDLIKSAKAQKWVGLQVVKVFLGIPIVPGR